MDREDLLARTFVELADVQSDDDLNVNVSQLVAERCMELFDVSAVGVLLAGPEGKLGVAASSSGPMRTAELFELRTGEGPCLESYRTGKQIAEPDLRNTHHRWRRFGPVALAAGFVSVHAIPIRVPGRMLGALNLFRADPGRLNGADILASQALAQAAALTLIRQPTRDTPVTDGQTPARPADQVLIEQAKGILAGQAAISPHEAADRIERYAIHHNLVLTEVCQQIVTGALHLTTSQENSVQRHRPD